MLSRISLRYFSAGSMSQKISPAVQFYLRSYSIDKSQVTPTGTKGMISKADVLKYIKEKQLKPVEYFSHKPVAAVSQTKPATQAAPKTTKTMGDPNDPFTQVITDLPLSAEHKLHGSNLVNSKHTIPHSYMVSQCSADKLHSLCVKSKSDIDSAILRIFVRSLSRANYNPRHILSWKDSKSIKVTSFESMLQDDAAEAYFGTGSKGLYNNTDSGDIVIINNAESGVSSAWPTLPKNTALFLSYTPFKDSLEPVSNFSFDPMDGSKVFTDAELSNSKYYKSKTVKISLTFDAGKLDTDKVAEILKHIKSCVEDPDLIHL